jgi:hypothetical protein
VVTLSRDVCTVAQSESANAPAGRTEGERVQIKEREDVSERQRAQLCRAMRPVLAGYEEALNLLPLHHPDRETLRCAARLARLSSGLGVVAGLAPVPQGE